MDWGRAARRGQQFLLGDRRRSRFSSQCRFQRTLRFPDFIRDLVGSATSSQFAGASVERICVDG
jgi:hypothetical protein